MRAWHLARALLLAWAIGWALSAGAQVAVPALSARVTDLTATLSAEQRAALERGLQKFEAKKGSQIGVLMLPSTAPETIEQYALRVAEQRKLGRGKVDDGALLIVAKQDRAVRIEVGYGLEGALNDAVSKRIISEIITPKFRQGDFYGGINAGLDAMMRVVEGEPLPSPAASSPSKAKLADTGSYLPAMLILALVVGGILRSLLGRLLGAVATGGLVALLAWAFMGALSLALLAGIIALLFTLFSGGVRGLPAARYRSGPGIGLGGLGGLGGFGGGGFHGGGGSFGGGGASGRW